MAGSDKSFQNKVFFPRAVSGESPQSILCIILRVAVSKEKQKGVKRLEDFEAKKKKGFLKKLTDENKCTLDEWINKEFIYITSKGYKLLKPYHSSAAIRGSESYDIIFEALMRAARPKEKASEVLEKFTRYFTNADHVDDLITKLYIDLSDKSFIKDEGKPCALTREEFESSLLCNPHARLFQNDIEILLKVKLPRRELLEMIISIISYHLCAYIVRMSFVAAEHERNIRKYSEGHALQKVQTHKCHKCRSKFNLECNPYEDYRLGQYLLDNNNCLFNPLFSIGSKEDYSKIKHELSNFPRRMFLFNELRDKFLSNKDDEFDQLSEMFYKKLTDKEETIKKIDEENTPRDAWKHPSNFFDAFLRSEHIEYGISSEDRKGNKQLYISNSLLKAFVLICCKQNEADEVFLDVFFEYLLRRGLEFTSKGKEKLLNQLEEEGLSTVLEDAGSARCVKNPLLT